MTVGIPIVWDLEIVLCSPYLRGSIILCMYMLWTVTHVMISAMIWSFSGADAWCVQQC